MTADPLPDLPLNLRDCEALARARLDPIALAFFAGGAGDEVTLRENVDAFARRLLRPRVLVNVASIDLATELLGTSVSTPIGIAPTAQHALAHAEAECATARAAAAAGALMCASTMSSRTLEEIGQAGGPRWFQLYVFANRDLTLDLVRRAEAAGYSALVLTVDVPVLGVRNTEVRGGVAFDIDSYGNLAASGATMDFDQYSKGLFDPSLTWDAVGWLRAHTSLPIVLKGIMTGEDAAIAVARGADGVWVSNHGGRQLDRVPATLDVLDEVVTAVDGRAEVYLDGGIRRGVDAATALAMGAQAVFLGRPVLWALCAHGAPGVAHMLDTMNAELANAMALLGAPSVRHLRREHVM